MDTGPFDRCIEYMHASMEVLEELSLELADRDCFAQRMNSSSSAMEREVIGLDIDDVEEGANPMVDWTEMAATAAMRAITDFMILYLFVCRL